MLEIGFSLCLSVCQLSTGSSAELSAVWSCIQTSSQACRPLHVIAKAPISPCRWNSLRKCRLPSTQESSYCMCHEAERPATPSKARIDVFTRLQVAAEAFLSQGNGYWRAYMQRMPGSASVERCSVFLHHLSDTLIYWCKYCIYLLTTN